MVHVVDGDTVHVDVRGQRRKVRMLRIDAPEMNEAGYREATRALIQRIPRGTRIELEYENERQDRHGRDLAYVFHRGENVNVEMVTGGYARFFDRYGAGRYADGFRAAENAAKAENKGIWERD